MPAAASIDSPVVRRLVAIKILRHLPPLPHKATCRRESLRTGLPRLGKFARYAREARVAEWLSPGLVPNLFLPSPHSLLVELPDASLSVRARWILSAGMRAFPTATRLGRTTAMRADHPPTLRPPPDIPAPIQLKGPHSSADKTPKMLRSPFRSLAAVARKRDCFPIRLANSGIAMAGFLGRWFRMVRSRQ
jgi:hypothetical protein